ncbi:MAG: flavodoxin [Lachnospiraceae bacterium]|nr:flavodoxin [Lachnospiraceae bacterium]
MNTAVRYYSRSGNTRAVAEAIAKGAGTTAVSVDSKDAAIKEPVDVLFVGGALYAYGIDKNLKEYLKTLKKEDAKRAVVFSTSWLSKHSLDLIKKGLEEVGIPVEAESFYLKSKEVPSKLNEAEAFGKRFV